MNLNFDYINTNDTNEKYIYRILQTIVLVESSTVTQLVFSIWSGMLSRLMNRKNKS